MHGGGSKQKKGLSATLRDAKHTIELLFPGCAALHPGLFSHLPSGKNKASARPYILKALMNERILAFILHFVMQTIHSGGLVGVAALMGIESACIPLPSEIIMPFAGYVFSTSAMGIIWVASAGAILPWVTSRRRYSSTTYAPGDYRCALIT